MPIMKGPEFGTLRGVGGGDCIVVFADIGAGLETKAGTLFIVGMPMRMPEP
jgi:hypothetical protein